MDILIVHDPREPAKKCSLTPLRGMRGVRFVPVRGDMRVECDFGVRRAFEEDRLLDDRGQVLRLQHRRRHAGE